MAELFWVFQFEVLTFLVLTTRIALVKCVNAFW